ncbi:MAG: hypothetical protein AAF570_03260, partial [Bacteroidota bacterium]
VQVGAHFMHVLVGDKANLDKAFRPVNFKKVHSMGSFVQFLKSGYNAVANGLTKLSRMIALILRDIGALAGKAFRASLRKAKVFKSDVAAKKWSKKVFGSNMNEFVGARLGPALTFAGFGLAIYNMTRGDTGIALAADIIELVSVSLEVFAIAGGWTITLLGLEEGFLVGMVSVAGTMSIIAAVVGIALMFIARWLHPKDPIQIFVDDYASPAGFAMPGKCSAIDYLVPPEYDLEVDSGHVEILGTFLKYNSNYVKCGTNGALTMGSSYTNLPENVLFFDTNGWGQTRITTIALDDTGTIPISMALTLKKDDTITFMPVEPEQEDSDSAYEDPDIQTQIWLSQTIGTPSHNGETATSMGLKFQALLPNSEGNFEPLPSGDYESGREVGYLKSDGTGIQYTTSSGSAGTFTGEMTSLAPNYMYMQNVVVVENVRLDSSKKWRPSFGIAPSQPLQFSELKGHPTYLLFDADSGGYNGNGDTPTYHEPMDGTTKVINTLQTAWTAQTDFQFKTKHQSASLSSPSE